jgi:hexosaminidase
MKKSVWSLVAVVALLLGACKESPSLSDSAIIPQPQNLSNSSGSFTLTSDSGIKLLGTGESITRIGQLLASKLRPATGFEVPVSPDEGDVVLELTGNDESEAYEIKISDSEVKISSSGEAGLFYGVQTFLQLFPSAIANTSVQAEAWTIPAGTIRDEPSYSYRGAMLDVARHFISIEDVKYYIDQMAVYKFNHLHLHLTDDQGWRIEIKSWPRLTEIGGSTQVGGGEGGFYTQEQYKEIVAYAADRFITVVPEVDMPGHTNAVLASYGELNPGVNLPDGDYSTVTKAPLEYEKQLKVPQAAELYTGIEVGWSTFNSKLELTYAFVDSVAREISAITPGPYFHIGGDESHVTEKSDYIYFVERVQDIISKYGKTSIGWDEVATAKLLPGNVAQFWAKKENALLAKDQGNQILMSPSKKAYLDMQYDSTSRIGLHWAAYIELDSAYLWEPTELVDGIGRKDIFGVEAPLWTETVTNRADIDYLAFPRLTAIAEVAWTKKDQRNWDSYRRRVAVHGKTWDTRGVGYYKSPKVSW